MILLIEEFLNFIHIKSNFVFFEHAKMLLPYGHPMSRLKVRKSLDNICFAKVICNWKLIIIRHIIVIITIFFILEFIAFLYISKTGAKTFILSCTRMSTEIKFLIKVQQKSHFKLVKLLKVNVEATVKINL